MARGKGRAPKQPGQRNNWTEGAETRRGTQQGSREPVPGKGFGMATAELKKESTGGVGEGGYLDGLGAPEKEGKRGQQRWKGSRGRKERMPVTLFSPRGVDGRAQVRLRWWPQRDGQSRPEL